MKKFLLGISLLFVGIIGFVGWIIGCAINNDGMAGLRIMETLSGSDLLIAAIFIIVILVGLFISLIESKKE